MGPNRNLPRAAAAPALLLCLGLAGCFEGPERVDPRDARPPVPAAQATRPPLSSADLPEGHPPIGSQLPPGHPTLQDPHGAHGAHGELPHGHAHGAPGEGYGKGEPVLAGRVQLHGDLAAVRGAAVFVVARPRGGGAALIVRKLDVAEADPGGADPGGAGPHLLRFELTDQDTSVPMSQVPAELDLEVYFDPDGIVETREGRVTALLTVRRGDLELDIGLDPAAGGSDG